MLHRPTANGYTREAIVPRDLEDLSTPDTCIRDGCRWTGRLSISRCCDELEDSRDSVPIRAEARRRTREDSGGRRTLRNS